MYRLGPSGKKWLKGFHVLLAGIWIGAGLSIMAVSIVGEQIAEISPQYLIVSAVIIDEYVIFPAALGVIVTGLIYSLFTNWGFFIYYWVTVKWILTLSAFLLGVIVLNPEMPETAAVLGFLQLILLLFMMFLSVFKPWGKRSLVKNKIK